MGPNERQERNRIADEVQGNLRRHDDYQRLYNTARIAGIEAGLAVTPTPMHVVEHANPLDDSSPVVRAYAPVLDGVCGFAWINVKPGNSGFAKWLVANGHARKDSYYGGVTIWISDYNQSMTRKEAHAYAMANVLTQAGIKAYANSRMD